MMPGRTGKQCRERYFRFLPQGITIILTRISSTQSGRSKRSKFCFNCMKKSVISGRSSRINCPEGKYFALLRTDNCVKNHFYSKLRKAVRKINKIIYKSLKKEFKEIKTTTLYKIIEGMDAKFRLSTEF